MKQGLKMKLAAVACTALLACMLAGCAQPATTSATGAQQANRAYMSQVNEAMVELHDSLDQFVAAVSRGDVVNMRTQADNAYKVLDKLAGIEAPDELKDVRDTYLEGTGKLRQALDGYIALYAEIAKSGSEPADYDTRIQEVQKLYDEGVAALQSGDEIAAGSSQSGESSTAAGDQAESSASASAPSGSSSSS